MEDNIIKDARNFLTLKKKLKAYAIKSLRNLLKLKKEKKAIKGRIIRDIRNLFGTGRRILL